METDGPHKHRHKTPPSLNYWRRVVVLTLAFSQQMRSRSFTPVESVTEKKWKPIIPHRGINSASLSLCLEGL